MKNLYGNTGKDFREQYLWELQRLVDGDRYTIKKYNVTLGVKQIPLIRLSELYFIAIESGSAESSPKAVGRVQGFQGIGQKGPSN